MQKHIVIAGGGYAGVLTAKKLCKRLKKQNVKITLVDRNPYHTMMNELHEAAAGRVDPESVIVPLEKIFKGRNVSIVTDTMLSVDTSENILKCENCSIGYDYLVVCTGSKPRFFGIEGAEKFSYTLWSYKDAIRLKNRIEDCFFDALHMTDSKSIADKLSFAVAGASTLGVEIAGEIAEYLPILCKRYDINPSLPSVTCVDAADRAVAVLPEKCSFRLERRLKKLGVSLLFNAKITSVSQKGMCVSVSGSEKVIKSETVIWAAGAGCTGFTSAISGITPQKNGRIATDEYLRAVGKENVYIGGDCLATDADKNPVPQMVENAEHSADIIAENISAEIKGLDGKVPYHPVFHGAMVSCGGRYGSAAVGSKDKKYILPSFIAMLVKHAVNMIYLFQVAGWNAAAGYIRDQIFSVRLRRSFVGGHFAAKSPTFMLVPLRIFLGVYWLIEAAEKIADGWFTSAKLNGFFSGAFDYFNTAAGGSEVNDAVTSATSSSAAAELIFRWKLLGVFDFAFVKGGGDYAFRSGFILTDWFINNVVLASRGTQLFFQYFILISEIVIGIFLILGLFSFITNAYALVLQALFLMTTGLYLSTWWLVFASLALLFKGGTSLGADYYAAPRIKRRLKSGDFTGKWYFYND